jgi:hypothetical protein
MSALRASARLIAWLVVSASLLAGCGGGAGGGDGCSGGCEAASPNALTVADVQQVIAQAVADTSARAVEFFAHRFGPYPYSSLALTQMPGDVSQGWPSLVFLSSFSFLTPQEKSHLQMSAVANILSDNVIAHETAHQWWGDLLYWKSYRDQWLFEALANYSALLLLESESPTQFRAVMEKYRENLVSLVDKLRKNGAVPILMTEPRWAQGEKNGLGESPNDRLEKYVEACRAADASAFPARTRRSSCPVNSRPGDS